VERANLSENSYICMLGLTDLEVLIIGVRLLYEFELDSLLGIVRVGYCTTVIGLVCETKKTGQRNAKRG